MRIIERLDKYMSINGLNDNKITVNCGLSVGLLGKARQSNNDIGKKAIEKILSFYQDINKVWLLTGEGEMLKRDGVIAISNEQINDTHQGTPVYDIDVTCGKVSVNFQDEEIIGYVDLPLINKNSHIVTASGNSMTPTIINGDRIALREIMSWDYIFFGQIYLILTDEYRMLKYIRKHQTDSNIIILRSENKEYDDIELPKSEIIKLFVVENILSITNMM